MNKSFKSINKVKQMINADIKRYLLKPIIKSTTYYHSMLRRPDSTTQFIYCSSLFFFVNVDIVLVCRRPRQLPAFRQCVSKSSPQTWRKSILLSKNHQKLFDETDHTDHNLQSFDAAVDRQQASSGCQQDHNTTCFIFLHSYLTKLIFLR
jgi:hypothetical protein